MKTLTLAVLAAAAVVSAAAPSFAQTINQRETNQQQRINQGVRSGELTPGEAARDERHLTSIDDQTARMRARNGGRLTPQERVHEQRRLNHESRRIYRTKHNGRVG
jgi:Ni/Co efflux regulator RcnB